MHFIHVDACWFMISKCIILLRCTSIHGRRQRGAAVMQNFMKKINKLYYKNKLFSVKNFKYNRKGKNRTKKI